MKHILTSAMFMDRTCCQRTRVAPKGPQNQDALYCIQGNLILLLAENIGSSPIDIMHSIKRYDIVNCNGLSCFCELRLIDFREISSGLLRDIYFSFLTTEIIQQYNLSSLLEIKSLAIFEAVITYHSKVKQCADSLHPVGSMGNRTYPRMFLLQCKVGFALNVDPIISR